MKLELVRIARKAGYTIGRLYVNGQRICDTLEDTDRGLTASMPETIIRQKKIYGQTAIPTGTYHISMDIVSAKFKSRIWASPYKGKLPRLLSVPGFDGVLIHPGNSPEDTHGCLLVGENRKVGQVLNSQVTFRMIMDSYLVPAAYRGEDITITVR